MRAYVGITDWNWFDFLRNQPHLDEVNFWRPSDRAQFKALDPNELFLFKLHAPRNYIVGGGFFAAYSSHVPISLAWESFEISNGAKSLSDMRTLVGKFKKPGENVNSDYQIGCILLEQPFFLPEMAWIPVPDWNSNIVQGKTYDLSKEPGLSIWNHLHRFTGVMPYGVREDSPRYGEPSIVRQRLGQGSFRIVVTDAYERRCAVTGERTLPALDAAHIKPYSESGEHAIPNGILLRRDLHALFDQGYVTINPEMVFEVSHKIKEEFENGRDYYRLHGEKIRVPANPANRPELEYLEWHNTVIYKG